MYKIVGDIYYQIGIHVGYDKIYNCNVAVVITPELENWIKDKLSELSKDWII